MSTYLAGAHEGDPLYVCIGDVRDAKFARFRKFLNTFPRISDAIYKLHPQKFAILRPQ